MPRCRMSRETIEVVSGGYGRKYTHRTVEVEYVKTDHWDGESAAYNVVIDGKVVGKIERAMTNTDRHYGMIRVPGKGRPAWSWRRAKKSRRKDVRDENYPGSYASTRAQAVAEILGGVSGERTRK